MPTWRVEKPSSSRQRGEMDFTQLKYPVTRIPSSIYLALSLEPPSSSKIPEDQDIVSIRYINALGALGALANCLVGSDGINKRLVDIRLAPANVKTSWYYIWSWIKDILSTYLFPGDVLDGERIWAGQRATVSNCFNVIAFLLLHPSKPEIQRFIRSERDLKAVVAETLLFVMDRRELDIQPVVDVMEVIGQGALLYDRILAFERPFTHLLDGCYDIQNIVSAVLKRMINLLQASPYSYCILLGCMKAFMYLERCAPSAFLARDAVKWITAIMYHVASPGSCKHARSESVDRKGEILEVSARYLRQVFSKPNSSGWVLQALDEKLLPVMRASEFFLTASYHARTEAKHIKDEFAKLVDSLVPHVIVPSILKKLHRYFSRRTVTSRVLEGHWKLLYERACRVRELTNLQKNEASETATSTYSRESCTSSPAPDRHAKICSGCLANIYCSKTCQKLDWKAGHRDLCKPVIKDRNSGNIAPLYVDPEFLLFWTNHELREQMTIVHGLREHGASTHIVVVDFDSPKPKVQLLSPAEIRELDSSLNVSHAGTTDSTPVVIISRTTGVSRFTLLPVLESSGSTNNNFPAS